MADANISAEAPDFAEATMPRLADLGESPGNFSSMRLVLEPGGLAFELTHPDLIVGRHSGADLRLPSPDVSRRHCRFLYAAGRWHVQDLKSLNGVYVNEALVHEAELRQGDRLRIGSFTFNVEVPGGAEGAASLLRRLTRDLPRFRPSSRFQRRAS